jgi:hypothetical protein
MLGSVSLSIDDSMAALRSRSSDTPIDLIGQRLLSGLGLVLAIVCWNIIPAGRLACRYFRLIRTIPCPSALIHLLLSSLWTAAARLRAVTSLAGDVLWIRISTIPLFATAA